MSLDDQGKDHLGHDWTLRHGGVGVLVQKQPLGLLIYCSQSDSSQIHCATGTAPQGTAPPPLDDVPMCDAP